MEDKAGRDAVLKPLRTSVVRLKFFKKAGSQGNEEYKRFGKLYKRLYLLALTPDALNLYTTKDAGDASGEDCKPESLALKSSFSSLVQTVKSPMRKMTGKRMPQQDGDDIDTKGQASPGSSDALQADLDDNQVFAISVSLNQIVSVSLHDDKFLKVAFRPNKISRNKVEEELTTFMKGLFFPVWYPLEAAMRDNWDLETFMENHTRKDPTVHTFCIQAADAAEAASLKAAIESATKRLLQALQWLSKDLPLLDGSSITLVSMDVHPSMLAPERGPSGGGRADPCQQVVVATHPSFGDRVPLPTAVSSDVAAVAGAGGRNDDGKGAGGAAVLHIWLNTPLGPTQADLVPAQLLRDSEVAAGCPFTLRAAPNIKDSWGKVVGSHTTMQGAERKLEVLLRCSLVRGLELPHGFHSSSFADKAEAPPAAADKREQGGVVDWRAGWVEVLRKPSESLLMGAVGILGILMVVWANLLASKMGDAISVAAAVRVLHSVSFLLTSLGAVAAIVLIALRFKPSATGSDTGARSLTLSRMTSSSKALTGTGPPSFRWYLELLQADLVECGEVEGAAPPMTRTLSVTAAQPKKEEGVPGKELPMPIQRLMEQHPRLVTANVAERFLIGWGTPSSAYGGLVDMVAWVKRQGLEGVVDSPQPHFHVIKRHYHHGVYGLSKSGCPVEIECMGTWKAAYEDIRRQGVSEEELLRHIVFTYSYTFEHIDPRPLPHGRTVKIVDLDGLCMGDLRSDAVKFLTKVGALLNLNYPQRLHRCFLVNAPTWWTLVWRMISPMIAKKTREQMFLFGKSDQETMSHALLCEVSPDQLPERYGGTSRMALYDSPQERRLAEHVAKVNAKGAAGEGPQAAAVKGKGEQVTTGGSPGCLAALQEVAGGVVNSGQVEATSTRDEGSQPGTPEKESKEVEGSSISRAASKGIESSELSMGKKD